MKIHRAALAAALSIFLTVGTASARTIEVAVQGLMCANCVAAVESKLERFAAAATEVLVSVEAQTVAIALVEGKDIDDGALEAAITSAGFNVVRIDRTDASIADIKARSTRSKH